MPSLPTVAPFESCVACFKGDTRTSFVLEGSAEWCIVGLMKLASLDEQTARALVHDYAENVHGCDPGMLPVGRIEFEVRLCRECASRSGATVLDMDLGRIARYVERDG